MWLVQGPLLQRQPELLQLPLSFGGLFARGLYAKYQQEGKDFVPLYKKMLNATSVTCVEDTRQDRRHRPDG